MYLYGTNSGYGKCQNDRMLPYSRFIHRSIQIVPLAFHLDIGLIHTPTGPYRALAPVERLLQLWAVFDHPPVDGRVIHVDTALEHEFFDMARAQRVGHVPADTGQDNLLGKVDTFE